LSGEEYSWPQEPENPSLAADTVKRMSAFAIRYPGCSVLAVHEAGHAVVAAALGLTVVRIEIGSGWGFCDVLLPRFLIVDRFLSIARGPLDALARLLVILSAGPITAMPGSGEDAVARWSARVLGRFDSFRELAYRSEPLERADDAGKAADALLRTGLSRRDTQSLVEATAAEAVGILCAQKQRLVQVASALDAFGVLDRPTLAP
jgi:hypothetical protein